MAWDDILSAAAHGTGYFVPGVGAAADAFDVGRGIYKAVNTPSVQSQQTQGQIMPQQSNISGMQPQGTIPGDVTQVPLYNQGQQQLLSQILGQLSGQLGQPDKGFSDIEKQSNLNLQQRVIPSIMERLTSLRGESLGGSDIAQALGGAAVQNQSNLDALRAQYNMGMFGPLLQAGLMPQQQTYFQPQGPSFLNSTGQALASGAGQAIPIAAVLALLSYLSKQQGGGSEANLMRAADLARRQ